MLEVEEFNKDCYSILGDINIEDISKRLKLIGRNDQYIDEFLETLTALLSNVPVRKVTEDNLHLYIEFEPLLKVIATGDEVAAITFDDSGIVCEDDYGACFYDYNEVIYVEDVQKQRQQYYS